MCEYICCIGNDEYEKSHHSISNKCNVNAQILMIFSDSQTETGCLYTDRQARKWVFSIVCCFCFPQHMPI